MKIRTDDEIRTRMRGAAWFGDREIQADHCYGCGQHEMTRKAYNGGQYLGWRACSACIAVWDQS